MYPQLHIQGKLWVCVPMMVDGNISGEGGIAGCTPGGTAPPLMSWYDLPSFLSHLCLSPTPSPSPSNSIRPHLPAFCHLCSNSEAYSCNYAMSVLRLALD